MFEIDHLISVAERPELALSYFNLRYCCNVCNSVKGGRLLTDPCQVMLSGALALQPDGQLVGQTRDSRRIIAVLGLNDEEFVQY